jgi:hypothetical protein
MKQRRQMQHPPEINEFVPPAAWMEEEEAIQMTDDLCSVNNNLR